MAFSLLTVGDSVYPTLVILDQDTPVKDETLSYFQPTCDCSASDKVKQDILAANTVTIGLIKEMIKADPYTAPPAPSANPRTAILVSTKCTGRDYIGVYRNPDGTTSEQLIASNSPSCP